MYEREISSVSAAWRAFCGLAVAFLCALVPLSAEAQRNLTQIPDPDPELERQSFVVAEGFEVNLYASDPRMAKPIQMNFDTQGRLWIASSEVYPQILPGQKADDKILIVEDADGDGTAEKTTVFADGLLIPTGVAPGDDGAYVANSTEIVHLSDTDGDGRADQRRIVLSGFGTEDTHHIIHTFRWGHDGALYFNQSIYIHSHVETPYGVRRLGGGGIWRFEPEQSRLDIFCRGFVNPWGHHFDRWGQSFATDGAYGEGINYVFPGAVFVTAPGAKRRVVGLNPGSPKHCGLEIVSGRHLPDDWQGNMITCDFRANRVCRFVVSEDASGFASRQETELIKSRHVAFRPIDVKMGPDGAIYIADWYNPIIQHGEVDFRDPRRDHVHGRIWRVTAKGRPLVPKRDFTKANVVELFEMLKAPEEFTRRHAKLALRARAREPQTSQVRAALEDFLRSLDRNDPDYEHHRLEALWTAECLQETNADLLHELLCSQDHRVRAAAVRVASRISQASNSGGTNIEPFYAAIRDDHPRVRLEAVRALAKTPTLESAALVATALDRPVDRFLDFALWQAMQDLAPNWLPAVQGGKFDFGGNADHLAFALSAVESPEGIAPLLALLRSGKVPASREENLWSLVASLGTPQDLAALCELLLTAKESDLRRQARLLGAVVQASQQRQVRPAGDLDRLANFLSPQDEELKLAAVSAAAAWKIESAKQRLVDLALAREPAGEKVRAAAIRGLAQWGGPENVAALAKLAAPDQPVAARKLAVEALAAVDEKLAAAALIRLLAELPAGEDPGPALTGLFARKTGPMALVAALAGHTLSADAAKLCIRAARGAANPSSELIAALEKSAGLSARKPLPTREEIVALAAEAIEKGDPLRGEEVYRRQDMACLKCHSIAGAGGVVGPDLLSIGASAPVDYLVESLLDPAAKVKENFHAVLVVTDDGRVVSGIPVRESKTELVLRDADDRQVTIPVDSIEEKKEGRSLMPVGLVDPLTRGELFDLVRFLSELGKVGPLAVGKTPVVRRWKSLTWTAEAHQRLNRTSYDTVAADDPALVWQPIYSRVSGDLPIADLPRFVVHKENDPTSFVRAELEVTTAGPVELVIPSIAGLMIWIDGRPTPAAGSLKLDLAQGKHTLTAALNQAQRREPLRIELGSIPGSPASVQIVGGK